MGALNSGMNAILVKTGKYREGDEHRIEKKPLFVADNFAHAIEFMLKNFPIGE
jgi:ribonucleotide monophosphatase NagD (HAD superfamily)